MQIEVPKIENETESGFSLKPSTDTENRSQVARTYESHLGMSHAVRLHTTTSTARSKRVGGLNGVRAARMAEKIFFLFSCVNKICIGDSHSAAHSITSQWQMRFRGWRKKNLRMMLWRGRQFGGIVGSTENANT